ncbi:hypothetical protein WAE58_22105 [Pedobacter panaciterrae]|uniref:G/U mismatch-specific uracil-DNA glycosylase n=1 Tax=Pedobacter panaciterrae TaxID=363849 RepID=A0ABU8NUS8_9SPHI
MTCVHKFFGHSAHLRECKGLLPAWEAKTLIVGTFNPEQSWHPKNTAKYYYGRSRNYLWKILPLFANEGSISHQDVPTQLAFLQRNKIALTDLLISINDADFTIPEHQNRIQTVLDSQIEMFNEFTWNTNHVLEYIKENRIEVVYFTKLGKANQLNVSPNSFEWQIRKIEDLCHELKIPSFRLHTPSGQGLGKGKPKKNKLIRKWFLENGGDHFPFLFQKFSLKQFPFIE